MVYIVGAGAGDPELITVKGQRLLRDADVVIYAGSLVNPELLKTCKASAEIYNSATMTLPEVLAVIESADAAGKNIVRLHTGDPAIFGAIQEQIDALAQKNISVEIVPGVSSFLAAAAALKQELTLPSVTQTVIITRIAGRTPVPERESLTELARHHSTLCIFLSVNFIAEVVDDLTAAGLSEDTPVAVVARASWADEKIIRGTLKNIAALVNAENIDRTALIIVGECLNRRYQNSQLYSPNFSHGFRHAKEVFDGQL